MQEELTPPRNLSSWFNKKFLQFASSTTSSLNPSLSTPRHHRTQSSPSYMSPTRSQMGVPGDEFVIGCSVCGTRAIEETCFADHPEYTHSIDDPNSGAYARIIAYYEKPLENINQNSTELKSILKSFNDSEVERQFEAVIESKEGSPVAKKIVYKEFSPPGKNPLTPLNYKEKQVVKECFFTNTLAEKYVKDQERKIVATRRDEYLQKSNGMVKTFVKTDVGEVKSKMLSRTASEANGFMNSKKAKNNVWAKVSTIRGRLSNSKNLKSNQKFKYRISSGEDFDNESNSSDMIVHFGMQKTSSKASLVSGGKSNKASSRATPSNKSQGSAKSGKFDKGLLKVPDGGNSNRSRNASPARSKNPSRAHSPHPPTLNLPKSKSGSRAASPFLDVPGTGTGRSKSPRGGEYLNIPSKSPKSSRSASPYSQSGNSDRSLSSNRSDNSYSSNNSNSKVPPSQSKQSKNLKPQLKNPKTNQNAKTIKNSLNPKSSNSKTLPRKHVNVALKSKKKVQKPAPLPKLFEPRSLQEFFFVQKIAATMIQRFWRTLREKRLKNSSSAQYEAKDFAGDCMFTSEELFKAMKLLGNFADYMERQGRKII